METLVVVVHVIVAVLIVGLVLLQQGKGADAGAFFTDIRQRTRVRVFTWRSVRFRRCDALSRSRVAAIGRARVAIVANDR